MRFLLKLALPLNRLAPSRPGPSRRSAAFEAVSIVGLLVLILVAPAAAPPEALAAIPIDWERHASFETNLNSDIDVGWNVPSPFTVTRTNAVGGADGSYAAKIVTNGGSSGCSCPRMKFEDGTSYGAGDEIWFGGSWRIPDPTKLLWSRLMNLGYWTPTGDPSTELYTLGLFSNSPGKMSVWARNYQEGNEANWSKLMPDYPIPANRWFDVDIHAKLSPIDGQALTEVYVDGNRVSSSTRRNMMNGHRLHFYNAGLSYFWPGNGNTTVYFDAPRLTTALSPAPPPSGPIPDTWRRHTSFETNLNWGTDRGWNISSPFVVTRVSDAAANGSYAAKIVTNGGSGGCSCPRMKFEDGFSYGTGSDVWMSGLWRFPNPSKVAWSRLMNLGHFEGNGDPDNWYLALESTAAGTMQVSAAPYGDPKLVVLARRPIPVNRWFRVDLHFKLSPTDGNALTEWYIDRQLVAQTTKANMLHPTPLHFYNGGLPYFWPGNGNTTVYFDAPRLTP
jgi:Polysaccharide lyase